MELKDLHRLLPMPENTHVDPELWELLEVYQDNWYLFKLGLSWQDVLNYYYNR